MLPHRMMMAAAGADSAGDSYTVLLIHSDTSDGSTTFTDSGAGPNCPHTITPTGDVHHETDQKKFGATSIYFDGNDHLSITDASADWNPGSGDFTIDFWVRHDNNTGWKTYLFHGAGATTNSNWHVDYDGSNLRLVYYKSNSPTVVSKAWSFSANTWYHIAAVRDDTAIKIFVDGNQLGSDGSISGAIDDESQTLYIGKNPTAGRYLAGYLDEIRISKGIARWTANFTPPTGPYS